jgi:LPXTG-motif cell wall-anchored protein
VFLRISEDEEAVPMGTHTSTQPGNVSRRRRYRSGAAALAAVGLTLASFAIAVPANAIATAVDLGTAESYAVLAGSTVTNTGASELDGDLGVSPGTAITGFPPGKVNGTIHSADADALQAQIDLTTAYNDAADQASDGPIPNGGVLTGLTLAPGVYTTAVAASLTGTVTLDAAGDPAAVWVFQIGSTLITGSNSTVALVNGATGCNVFWQVGSSATLGTDTTFVGTIMALTSISLLTRTTVDGRALARNGAVTLDENGVFPDASCTDDTDGDGATDAGDADIDAGDADIDGGDADIDAGDADAGDADIDAGDADTAVDTDAAVDVDVSTDTDAAVDVAPDWDVEEVVAPAPVTAAAPALAATGFDGMWLIPMGSVLLMGGAVLLIARRKRAER